LGINIKPISSFDRPHPRIRPLKAQSASRVANPCLRAVPRQLLPEQLALLLVVPNHHPDFPPPQRLVLQFRLPNPDIEHSISHAMLVFASTGLGWCEPHAAPECDPARNKHRPPPFRIASYKVDKDVLFRGDVCCWHGVRTQLERLQPVFYHAYPPARSGIDSRVNYDIGKIRAPRELHDIGAARK
jgi:hypothetical protein